MTSANWKRAVGAVALVLLVLLARRLTRHVSPFEAPGGREIEPWGTIDAGTALHIQSILDESVNTLQVPGMQAYVRTADGRTWSGVSGTIDLARKTPMRRDHVLRVGSTTKTYTAVVLLNLVEEGKLDLDDPLAKWFSDFPNADEISVHQLLDHSSGIADVLETEVLMKSIIPWTFWEPQQLVEIAGKAPVHFAPGTGWWYSNTNYILLGLIAERVSGKTAAQLLHEVILDPLGLTNTSFLPYETAPVGLVRGWDRDLSHFPGMLDIAPRDVSWATAAFTSGAMVSTADELGAFYDALFAGELLAAASMREMTTFVPADNPGFAEQNGYGLGLMRITVDGHELIGHVGQFMGSTAMAMHSPDESYTIVLTTNLSYPPLIQTLAELQAAMP